MKIQKKLVLLFLALMMVFSISGLNAFAATGTPLNTPAQIVAAMTEDPQHSVTITFTTIETDLENGKVALTANGETKRFDAVKVVNNVTSNIKKDGAAVTQKAFYTAKVTGLMPDTNYTYICSVTNADGTAMYESPAHTLKTAPSENDEFTFAYLADTQSSGVNGKAVAANTSLIKQNYPDLSFIYIAGDLTDNSTNEQQWETFFNQKGDEYVNATYINNNFESAMSDFVLAAVQGNHDNNTMAGHISYPQLSADSKIVYAYTYGSARFIMLNLESARSSTSSRDEQKAFLTEQVADAKAKGLWTIVGFHKSIYTGASHITDSDVIDARKFWSPVFAELNVDIVLQGHDHVLSRGFIDAQGAKLDITNKISDKSYTAQNPENAPLYYVGNCASTLKFYSLKNYTVGSGDPLTSDYSFLDVNSARPQGHDQNIFGPQTDVYRGPTYTTVNVANDKITFETYIFKYDPSTDTITEAPTLYDRFVLTREVSEEKEKLEVSTDANIIKKGDYFRVDAGFDRIVNSNTAMLSFSFDSSKFDYRGFTAAEGVTPVNIEVKDGKVVITVMVPDYNTKDYGQVLFSAKDDADLKKEENIIGLDVDYVFKNEDGEKTIKSAYASTSFTSTGGVPGDVNADGKVTLLDLSDIIDVFGIDKTSPVWNAYKYFDFNGNNEIDIQDIAHIAKLIV